MGVRNVDWLPPIRTLIGDQTRNLGICPDKESNPQLLVYRTRPQPPEPPDWWWDGGAGEAHRDDVLYSGL